MEAGEGRSAVTVACVAAQSKDGVRSVNPRAEKVRSGFGGGLRTRKEGHERKRGVTSIAFVSLLSPSPRITEAHLQASRHKLLKSGLGARKGRERGPQTPKERRVPAHLEPAILRQDGCPARYTSVDKRHVHGVVKMPENAL